MRSPRRLLRIIRASVITNVLYLFFFLFLVSLACISKRKIFFFFCLLFFSTRTRCRKHHSSYYHNASETRRFSRRSVEKRQMNFSIEITHGNDTILRTMRCAAQNKRTLVIDAFFKIKHLSTKFLSNVKYNCTNAKTKKNISKRTPRYNFYRLYCVWKKIWIILRVKKRVDAHV